MLFGEWLSHGQSCHNSLFLLQYKYNNWIPNRENTIFTIAFWYYRHRCMQQESSIAVWGYRTNIDRQDWKSEAYYNRFINYGFSIFSEFQVSLSKAFSNRWITWDDFLSCQDKSLQLQLFNTSLLFFKNRKQVFTVLTSSGKYFMHIQDESILWMVMNEYCFVLNRHTEPVDF